MRFLNSLKTLSGLDGDAFVSPSGQIVRYSADWRELMELADEKGLDLPRQVSLVDRVLKGLGIKCKYAEADLGEDGKWRAFWR